MNKRWTIVIAVALFLSLAVGITVPLLMKSNSQDLNITAENISINVGDKAKVVYDVSVDNAAVFIKSDNVAVAKIEIADGDYCVCGIAEGNTELVITARLGKEYKVKRVAVEVKVVNNPTPPSEPDEDDEDETPPVVEPEPESPTTPPEELPVEPPIEEDKPELTFDNFINCSFVDDVFYVSVNTVAVFTISADINIVAGDITVSSNDLLIEFAEDIGDNTYKITGTTVGEFEIEIKVKTFIYKFKVMVEAE